MCYTGDIYINLLSKEAMFISSIHVIRVCFKTFSTKMNLDTCTDILFDTVAVLLYCPASLWINQHHWHLIYKFDFIIVFELGSD